MENTGTNKDLFLIYLVMFFALLICFCEIVHYNSYFLQNIQANSLLQSLFSRIYQSYFIRENGLYARIGFILISAAYVWVVRVLKVKEKKSFAPYVLATISLIILLTIKLPFISVSHPWALMTTNIFYIFALAAFPVSLMDIKSQMNLNTGYQFKQNKKAASNPLSITWKTKDGHVNVTEPQRGVSIIGGPGSGKSYTLVEEVIKQLLSKGCTALVYDFKFPTLTRYTYSVMRAYGWNADKEKTYPWAKGIIRLFYFINFTDIRYSHRSNPLAPKVLNSIAMAGECSMTILCNLNREWIKRRGFFEDSAIVLFTAILWFNRKYSMRTGKNFSTLPHAIAFATMPDAYIIPILMDDLELRASAAAVASAFEKGAGEQLAGVVATLQNSVGKLNIPEMFYVMTEREGEENLKREERLNFSADINNPEDPKVIVLGNDDRMKQVFAPALSLYASVIANTINQKHKNPCLFCVDEAPTIYIPKLDNLPNTGRSNGVITVLAAQDYSQYDRDYGKDEARVLKAGLGNIFIGEVGDLESAKFASSLFGKKHMRKVATTISSNDITKNYSDNLEELFPPDSIMGLNQGDFVGKVTKSKEKTGGDDLKLFNSRFIVEKEYNKKDSIYNKDFEQELPLILNINEEQAAQLVSNTRDRIFAEVEAMVRYEFIIVTAKHLWKMKNEFAFKAAESNGGARAFIEKQMPEFFNVLNAKKFEYKNEAEAINKIAKEFYPPLFAEAYQVPA